MEPVRKAEFNLLQLIPSLVVLLPGDCVSCASTLHACRCGVRYGLGGRRMTVGDSGSADLLVPARDGQLGARTVAL